MSDEHPMDDLLVEGFEKLPANVVDNNPPRLKLLPGFYKKTPDNQHLYLLRLASTMNHAAKLISDERDQLVKLLVKKDEQLSIMEQQLRDNNEMLQFEVGRMNDRQQSANDHAADLTQRIRLLEDRLRGLLESD